MSSRHSAVAKSDVTSSKKAAGVGRNVLEAVVLEGNSQVERSRTVGWDKGLAIRKR
ncbi:uncharacterized protein FTOL_09951 [Fusarium torulosum]|uniref:Uncharacterized protein n=1 Tax=Fusarium torulosum TaxID=33205 RepID=A0AAE8MFS2_9HYPO|nr:uncharacterized protein FTOL_09951 [Fusarium torulosum]